MTLAAIRAGALEVGLFLNRPPIKEGIKKVVGSITFAFGLIELYDLYQIARGRGLSDELSPEAPRWAQVAHKVVTLIAKLSLLLSAATSPPALYLFSCIPLPFEALFGPNTTFALNPWHPRHLTSIAACLLSLPALLEFIYPISPPSPEPETTPWLTDARVRLMALFNAVTSRPAQHLGNALFWRVVRGEVY